MVTLTEPLPRDVVTLGKGSLFVECLLYHHSAKLKLPVVSLLVPFVECVRRHMAKVASVLSVLATTLRQISFTGSHV